MIGGRSIANALRRTASWLAPSAAPAYDAAGHGRRTQGWQPTTAAINAILFSSADTLRTRSRDMARKNPWANQGSQRYASNAIGTGIKPQSQHPDNAVRR